MRLQKPKLLILVGPTASGKTGLAVELAKKFNGEVISADSRQVYRGLDIGTAKTTKEEMAGVPHHLIDVADPEETYTAANFVQDSQAAVADITKRSKLPIIAGGTFFYVDALLGRTSLPEVPPNPELREYLETKSAKELYATLQNKDSRRAATIEPDNKRRLVRALEIAHELDYVPSPTKTEPPFDYLIIGIEADKETLRDKFKQRAEAWLKAGFLKEIEGLLESGLSRERLLEIGFEYRLGLELLDKELTVEEFAQKFIEKNWQYARKQMSWLKRDEDIKWFSKDDPEIFREAENFLKS